MLSCSSIQDLPEVIENEIMQYFTPRDYMMFTSMNRRYMAMRKSDDLGMVAVSTAKLLHKVFDQGKSVLLHGPGGCGKTQMALTQLFNRAVERGKRIIMTGTTGVSSCALPMGMTIHSFSGLGKATIPLEKLKEECTKSPERTISRYSQWKSVDILVIDEISMMGTRLFALLDYLARFVREDARPFGGLQLVMSGDFLQLPPIGDQFVFKSPIWQQMHPEEVTFLSSMRQKQDQSFFRLLKRIRIGTHTRSDLEILARRKIDKVPEFIVQNVGKSIVPPFMFSRHLQVEALNKTRMDSLPGDAVVHNADDELLTIVTERDPITGKSILRKERYVGPPVVIPRSLLDRVEHRQPSALPLKPMAQYILTQNFRTQHKLVNGAVCLSMPVEQGRDQEVEFRDGKRLPLTKLRVTQVYRVFPRQNLYLKRTQYALRVGYAVTIHAAQGMTLDQAVVDAGSSVFASAQTYVACSRVRNLSDLYLLDFHEKSLKVNAEAREYVARIEGIDLPHHKNPPPPAKKRKIKPTSSIIIDMDAT